MQMNLLSERVIGCAIEVHRQLDPGLLESVYEESLCYELASNRLSVVRQKRVPIAYKSQSLSTPLRLDLLVEDQLVLEIKAKDEFHPIDKQQLLTYSRLCNLIFDS